MAKNFKLTFALLIVLVVFLLSSCISVQNSDFLIKISSRRGTYSHPRWSEDGETILFQFVSNNSSEHQFVTVDSDGGNWNQLEVPSRSDFAIEKPDWWDQDQIAYIFNQPNAAMGIVLESFMIHDLNTGESETVSENHPLIYDTCWDKPNNLIIYLEKISHRLSQEGSSLQVMDFQTNHTTTIVEGAEWFILENLACDFQNGQVAYTFMDISSRPHIHSLIVEDLDSGESKTLIGPIDATIGNLTWSPDGEWLAVQMFGDTPETRYQAGIVLVASDGSEVIEVTGIERRIFPVDLDWSPKNDVLVVTSLDGVGRYSMHLLDLSSWLKEE
ncbi:hypothetical protein [Candidatus Leptofilum sp.]|uniref:hypothetical protein n=1 Tax=Candidatus Leptofilum sp. TaxID=3241576 RepID=UPI003B59A6A8